MPCTLPTPGGSLSTLGCTPKALRQSGVSLWIRPGHRTSQASYGPSRWGVSLCWALLGDEMKEGDPSLWTPWRKLPMSLRPSAPCPASLFWAVLTRTAFCPLGTILFAHVNHSFVPPVPHLLPASPALPPVCRTPEPCPTAAQTLSHSCSSVFVLEPHLVVPSAHSWLLARGSLPVGLGDHMGSGIIALSAACKAGAPSPLCCLFSPGA